MLVAEVAGRHALGQGFFPPIERAPFKPAALLQAQRVCAMGSWRAATDALLLARHVKSAHVTMQPPML